ncbi:MAG: TolC family protein [Thermodesulfobacteria bacterium]|nr:TolC family protein [Thermodesulfobacteriota bacterium]
MKSALKKAGPKILLCIVLCCLGTCGPISPRPALSGQASPFTLEDCVSIALENNLKIVQKQYEQQARAYAKKATFKEMLPSLSTNYSYTGRRDAATIVIFGRTTTIYGHDEYKWDVTLKQPIFYGGLLWNRYKKAHIDVDLASLALFGAKNEIIKQTKVAYYQVVKSKMLLREAKAQLTRLRAQYETVKAFYEASLRPKTDLLQSKVQLKQGELALITARHQYDLAKNRLNLLMRRSLEAPLVIDEEVNPEVSCPPIERLYQLATENRPEIRQARLSVERARRDIQIASSGFWPRVDLTASYTKDGVTPDVSDNPYGDHENALVLLNASWEFFAWGKSMDKVAAAKRQLEAAKAQLQDVIDHVRLEVKNAYLLFHDAKEGIKVARSALDSAKEDYELNVSRYKNQLASNTDVLDAQSRLTKARSDYISAVASELTALANIEYAIGRELDKCMK